MKWPERKIHRHRKQAGSCQALRARRPGSDCLVGMGFPFEMMKMFWNSMEVMTAQDFIYSVVVALLLSHV